MNRIHRTLASMMLAGLLFAAPASASRAHGKSSQELPGCPANATRTNDTSGMSSFGFRWLRTDDSTCSAAPDSFENTIFEEGASKSLTIDGSDPQSSVSVQLTSPEYRTLRTFYIGPIGHYVTEVVSPGYYETVPGRPGYYETVPGTPPSCTTIPGTPGYYDDDGDWVDGTPDETVCDPGTPDTEVWVPGTPDAQVWVPEVDRQVWVQDGAANFYADANEYTGGSSVAQVELDFADRDTHPVYPWESETFSVSYDAGGVRATVSTGSYNYDVQTEAQDTADGVSAVVTLTPGAKVRTAPDLSAITGAVGLSNDGLHFALTLQDKWAQYYQGEDVELEVTIAAERNWWIFDLPDANVYKGGFILRTQPSMVQYLDTLATLPPGHNYDVSFRWHRLQSKISTADWSDVTTLPEATFSPRSSGGARRARASAGR